uniref:Uncharacterized protein n=1 Tax=Panagrellus redivivus TaxID=6233 RepID=A0A7E4VNG3_PANRE
MEGRTKHTTKRHKKHVVQKAASPAGEPPRYDGIEELRGPRETAADIREIILATIDTAAEKLKSIPRVSATGAPPPQFRVGSTKYEPKSCTLCPLAAATKDVVEGPHVCRDTFYAGDRRSVMTREYLTATGTSVAAPVTPLEQSLVQVDRLNTIVIEGTGPDVSGLTFDLRLKLTKPDGTARALVLGIEIPNFD